MKHEISIPAVPHERVTVEIVKLIKAFERSLTADTAKDAEAAIAREFGISSGTQRRYKAELRKLFGLQARGDLGAIARHPKLQHALEYVMTRNEREDRGTLRSARDLGVVMPSGELVSVADFLKSLYPREGVNATSCYRTLKARTLKGLVKMSDGAVATLEDLPSEPSVIRFLKQWRRENIAVRRGRSRKHDFETLQQPYVTRDVSQYRPGELWIGDHTELDFIVLNEQGKPDRRWITSYIDIRTSFIVGYYMSWQPNSETVALAYRNAVIGNQLKAFTNEGTFEPVSMTNVPETVMIDNGKDYRSNYTQRIFGKIDFEDSARLSIERMTKLHYVLPYHGQSKAQMERWYKTIQTMLKYLPGFKGNKYQNKPDSLKEDLKQGRIMNVEQFDAMVAVTINSYNNRVHRSLKNQTPFQCYLTNMTHQRSIDLRVLDFLLHKVQGRRVRRCQVTLFSKEYYSEKLLAHNDKLADVYYDPMDLGFVSIYIAGEEPVVASNKEMIGQDERGWLKILHARKHSEKEMQSELRTAKKGLTDHEARMMLLEGELLNMSPVSKADLAKKPANVTLLTGLEQRAKENQAEVEKEKNLVEIEKKARKSAKTTTLDPIAVNERIR